MRDFSRAQDDFLVRFVLFCLIVQQLQIWNVLILRFDYGPSKVDKLGNGHLFVWQQKYLFNHNIVT